MNRKDKSYLPTISFKDIDAMALADTCRKLLNNINTWKAVHDKQGIKVFTKKGVFGGITSVGYQTVVQQGLSVIEDFAYEHMLDFMPAWSKEFIGGKQLLTLREKPNMKLLKTQFKTPFFLHNRSYVFGLIRVKTDNALYIIYVSVNDEAYQIVDKGFVRARLYPTVYRFTQQTADSLLMEHVLSTDLGGDLPLWFQNLPPVVNGYVQANIRDCVNIKRVLENWG